MSAVRSFIDPNVVRAMTARRRSLESDANSKLACLRRLELQKVLCELPETRVEQSFNEQLFARIFGYRTLLSHDGGGVFHMMPKNPLRPRRLDDFSLGFFGNDEPVILATAEFKGPGVDLAAPQVGGAHAGITPIEQAFSAALDHPTCRFVIVSNFRELRLYAIDGTLLAIADLLLVRTPEELAVLCVHFDRWALLGHDKEREPEMSTIIGGHPVRGFDKEPDRYRVQWLFTPESFDVEVSLYELEEAFLKALEKTRSTWVDFPPPNLDDDSGTEITIASGWLIATSRATQTRVLRAGISRDRQLVLNASVATNRAEENIDTIWTSHALEDLAALFGVLVSETRLALRGYIELVLSDVRGFVLRSNPGKIAVADEIVGRGTTTMASSPQSLSLPLADCVCEVFIHFRDRHGGATVEKDKLESSLAMAMSSVHGVIRGDS